MDELEKKLEEIIFGDMPKHFMSDHMLAKPERIRQAFVEAGWAQEPRQFDKYGNLKINGREWYDRFEKELAKTMGRFLGDDGLLHEQSDAPLVGKTQALAAAKKAGGAE